MLSTKILKFLKIFFANYKAECEHVKNMSPFLTCFPLLPFGRALRAGQLDAIDFVAIAIPSLCSLRRAHIKRRRLIMPLVALVQKKSQRTRNFVLSSGAWHSLRGAIDFVAIAITRRRCSSNSVFEKESA